MKPRRRMILLAMAGALFLGLAYLNQAFIFTYLIEPVARILWLAYRTLLTVNQETYWLLLILGGMILLLKIIPDTREIPVRPAYFKHIRTIDRVAHWERLLKSAQDNPHYRLVLQHELEALRRSIGDQAATDQEGDIHLPTGKTGVDRHRRQAGIGSRFSIKRRKPRATEFEKTIDLLLKSMETQLEIQDDRISNIVNHRSRR